MRIARASLLAALPLMTCASAVFAKTSETISAAATPVGAPSEWLASNDYPPLALRYNMSGTTSFKLTVDETGRPSRCDIVESSGFDVLDRATCERVLANAKFTPARRSIGKPIASTFSSRVRWIVPGGRGPAITERFYSVVLTIDQAGNATSCRMVFLEPATEAAALGEKPCGHSLLPPPALGMAWRAGYNGPLAKIEIQQADVFTPDLRARVLAPKPGYEIRALNMYSIAVTKDGKIGQCSYVEQRGNDASAADYCAQAWKNSYDPPFSAFDKDGVAHGWHIIRVLRKTGG